MNQEIQSYLKELKQYGIENDIPNVTEYVGQFLNMLVRIKSPKNILEIGCANGYSTIWMAEVAKSVNAKIYAIDHSKPTFEAAKKNISTMGFDDVVKFYFGDAINVINNFSSDLLFDFVFVDGEKGNYLDFWNVIQPRLSKKSVIVFDDMVLFPEKTKNFSEAVKDLPGYDQLSLPDGDDGILLLIKN